MDQGLDLQRSIYRCSVPECLVWSLLSAEHVFEYEHSEQTYEWSGNRKKKKKINEDGEQLMIR